MSLNIYKKLEKKLKCSISKKNAIYVSRFLKHEGTGNGINS